MTLPGAWSPAFLMGMFTIEEFSGRIVDLTHPPRTTLTLSISWEGLDHTQGPHVAGVEHLHQNTMDNKA